jgi:hypothetical protein
MQHLLDKSRKPSSIDKKIHRAVEEIPRLSLNWSVLVRFQELAAGRRALQMTIFVHSLAGVFFYRSILVNILRREALVFPAGF